MAYDNEQYLHREWLGLLQPEGLVVSPPALVDAQAFVNKRNALRLQPLLQSLVKHELVQGLTFPAIFWREKSTRC